MDFHLWKYVKYSQCQLKWIYSEPPNKTRACNNNGLVLWEWWKYESGFAEGARRRLSCCKGYRLTATANLNKARTPPGSLCAALVVYRSYKPVLSRQGSIFGLCRQWEVYYYAALLRLVKWLLSGPVKSWILSVQFRSSSCSLPSGIMSRAFTVNANTFFLALWSHVLSIVSGQTEDTLLGAQLQPSTRTSAFPCGPSAVLAQPSKSNGLEKSIKWCCELHRWLKLSLSNLNPWKIPGDIK